MPGSTWEGYVPPLQCSLLLAILSLSNEQHELFSFKIAPEAVQQLVAITKNPRAQEEAYATTTANALSSMVKVCFPVSRLRPFMFRHSLTALYLFFCSH